jgi:hypothetical protein
MIGGKLEKSVMVWTAQEQACVISNVILFEPGFRLAKVIAWRKLFEPTSFVFVTLKTSPREALVPARKSIIAVKRADARRSGFEIMLGLSERTL